ncbi:PAS domain S-box protein [Microcoleus sp. B5-D4]|uniref:PAS domain S-box protein n=1 Tax=unclassified Microcoleus TaxID=2642155 RepID=UPI002FD3AD1E
MSNFPPENTQPPQQESATAQALRQAHFEAFFAGANAGMVIFDRQLRYVQINEVLAEIDGICVADYIGRSLPEMLPELAPTLEPMLQGILDTGQPILECEVVGETAKEPGIIRYWETSYYPLRDENGIIFGIGGIVIEISDRKRAEQKQARLTAILEATSDLVGVVDVTGHSVYLNKAGQKMLGMSPEEARSPFTIDSVLAPSAKAKFHNEIIPAALQEGSWGGEILFLSRDEQEIPVSQVLIVHKTEAGEVEFISTIVRDIRDRKNAEDVLKQSEERFRSLIEATAQIIWIANAEGELASEQPTLCAFTGQTFDDYKGGGGLNAIHPDDRSSIATAWSTAVANRSFYEVEFRMRRYDGEYRYMSCRGVPILNADGSIREWIGANTDITDRKQAEEALREQQAALRDRNLLLSSILESTPDIIVVKDREGRYVALNSEVAKSFYGRSIEEIIGKDDSELLPPEAAVAIMAKDRQIMKAGITETYEEDVSNGKCITSFLTTKAPWRDAQGNIIGLIAIARNINDRKQMEAELRDRNALLKSILESTPDFIVVKDREGRYVAVNSNVANFMGQPIEEIIGKDDLEFLPHESESVRAIMAKDRQVMATGIAETYEEEVSQGETTATIFTTKTPWRDAKGNILGIIAISRDISDRKQAEDAIKQSEERYRSLIAATSQLVWTADAEGRSVDQPSWRAYTGQTEAQMADGFGWLDAIHPDDRERTAQVWMEAVQTKTLVDIEYRIRGADGNYRYFQVRGVPILNEDGSIREWIGTCSDIHDRKQAEDAIKQSEERYRSLTLAISQIVWTTDPEGRCQDSPSMRAYTGQTEAEGVGFGWLDTIHPDDRERTVQVWMKAVQTRSLFEMEYRMRGTDGNYRYFQARGVPILNEDGSIREWVGTCIDIQDRKQTEIVQAKAREAAEAASRAKSEFLANMSHELRTPLNGIMGYAQILQRSKVLNEEERSRIDVIYQCGSHLLTLINDILDLSKIEAQKVELMPTDFHFPAFLQGVAEMCRIRAELKGIHFHFPSSPELPIGIRADEKRLRQVLINLLSNAIKFTDEGSVTFIVSFATEGKIRFEVRDTGTGIAQEQLEAIFQPFEQVGDRRRQTEGTGLGLAISQRIVELMGSTIQVQSEMNVGSIFWFDVSLPQADEWVKTSQIDHHGQIIGIKDRQPKIVVIDDKWANRSVINNLLSPIGFEVFEANDGLEGWEKILEVQPDLIVTDLLMPELDGFEVIKRVRESENFKDTVIIVSSASVFETDQYRSLEAGGNAFIPKPIQATELLQNLQQYLDLEWVYEANEEPLARSSDTDELIAPPATEMEMLYELAMKGNFLEIVKQAILLEELEPQYIPFAKRLHQMAKDFQDEELLTFIESYK